MTFDEAVMLDEGVPELPSLPTVEEIRAHQHRLVEDLRLRTAHAVMADRQASTSVVLPEWRKDQRREGMHIALLNLRSAIDALLTMTGGVQ